MNLFLVGIGGALGAIARYLMSGLIETAEDIARGLKALRSLDPALIPLIEAAGELPLRRRAPGFQGLAQIIIAQQVSVASAAAIQARFERAFPPETFARLAEAGDAEFRACGLSAPKIRTIRACAIEVFQNGLELEALGSLPAEEVKARLTAIKGIGPWTADVFMLFCLGHADAFAPGDLALQEAARIAFRMRQRPDAEKLAMRSRKWRPWRAVAARLLWQYYRVIKTREGVA